MQAATQFKKIKTYLHQIKRVICYAGINVFREVISLVVEIVIQALRLTIKSTFSEVKEIMM